MCERLLSLCLLIHCVWFLFSFYFFILVDWLISRFIFAIYESDGFDVDFMWMKPVCTECCSHVHFSLHVFHTEPNILISCFLTLSSLFFASLLFVSVCMYFFFIVSYELKTACIASSYIQIAQYNAYDALIWCACLGNSTVAITKHDMNKQNEELLHITMPVMVTANDTMLNAQLLCVSFLFFSLRYAYVNDSDHCFTYAITIMGMNTIDWKQRRCEKYNTK